MPLKSMRYKVEWLDENVQKVNLHTLRACFESHPLTFKLTSLKKSTDTKLQENGTLVDKLPVSLRDAIFLDIAYCIFKHQKWIHSRLFQTIIIENFYIDFSLDRDLFADLLKNLIVCIDPRLRIPVRPDREFLLHILIQTMTSTTVDSLVSEIGLGSEILNRLRNAAENIEDSNRESTSICFLPEIDRIYSDIVFDLSKELEENPQQMDAYKLKFSLKPLPDPWAVFLEEFNGGWLLDMLTLIGQNRGASTSEIGEYLETRFHVFEGTECAVSTKLLLNSLAAQSFIFPLPMDRHHVTKSLTSQSNGGSSLPSGEKNILSTTNKKGVLETRTKKKTRLSNQIDHHQRRAGKLSREDYWHLTEKSQLLTAQTNTSRFLAAQQKGRGSLISQDDIISLCGPWQSALIDKIPLSAEILLALLASDHPLSPETYPVIIRRLTPVLEHKVISDVLELRIRSLPTPEIRRAICDVSRKIQMSDSLTNLISQLAVNDSSASVRLSALSLARPTLPGKTDYARVARD